MNHQSKLNSNLHQTHHCHRFLENFRDYPVNGFLFGSSEVSVMQANRMRSIFISMISNQISKFAPSKEKIAAVIENIFFVVPSPLVSHLFSSLAQFTLRLLLIRFRNRHIRCRKSLQTSEISSFWCVERFL